VDISLDSKTCTFILDPKEKYFKLIYDSTDFVFRKNQVEKGCNRIIVKHRSKGGSIVVLEKNVDGSYKVYRENFNWIQRSLMKNFIQGINDFYYLDGKFYNETNEEIKVVHPKWTQILALSNKTYHIKDDLYLAYETNSFLILFDYQPKITFVSPTQVDFMTREKLRAQSLHFYELDDIVLKNFKMRPGIIKDLRKLDNLDEMKQYISKELAFNII
jgi:hypothetical protein